MSYEDIIPSFIPLLLATWKPIKHFRRVKSSSLPWCCALSWRGGLRALVTPRAMMAGAYAPDMLNYARLLYGQRARLNSTLVHF